MPYSTTPSSGAPSASATAARNCSSIGGMPGSGSSGASTSDRAPVARTAAAIRSGSKYISTLVVTPLRSISADAAVIATSMSSGVSRASRGHMTSCSQRSSGSPSPCPRNSTIGACEWALTMPGISRPGRATTSASRRRRLGGRADPAEHAVVDVDHRVADDGARPVADDEDRGGEALRHGQPNASRRRPGRRPGGVQAPRIPLPMHLLAAAASSDQGGITGFLLDLVDKLGPVGVGLRDPAGDGHPADPQRGGPRRGGRADPPGDMNVVSVVVFATIGSLLGAIFFYWLGRGARPAALARLPRPAAAGRDRGRRPHLRVVRAARPLGGVLRPDGADRAQFRVGAGRRGQDELRAVPALHRRRQPDLEQPC